MKCDKCLLESAYLHLDIEKMFEHTSHLMSSVADTIKKSGMATGTQNQKDFNDRLSSKESVVWGYFV